MFKTKEYKELSVTVQVSKYDTFRFDDQFKYYLK
jgi:hypothetical protein